MTALTDVRRLVKSIARGDAMDEHVLLRYYGADGPPFVSASQSEIAKNLGLSRQAVYARIARLLGRVDLSHREKLTLDEPTRASLISGEDVERRLLGGLRPENASRFYRNISAEPVPRPEDAPLPRIPARQFDALVQAAYGLRRAAQIAAARRILVQGHRADRVAQEVGIPEIALRRTAHEIADLHRRALAAYAT